MSSDQKEQILSLLIEAYQKGETSRDITVESLFDEIKQKLVQIIENEKVIQKEI